MFVVLGVSSSILATISAGTGIAAESANEIQSLKEIYLYPWLLILVISFFTISGIFDSKIYLKFPKWVFRGLEALRDYFISTEVRQVTGNEELDKAIAIAGYSYDIRQDVFYSSMDPWQRSMGYCRLYDEAAAPLNLIIDCEPIYFEYDGKRWMIEFWKGQYALTTGCEIGVYTTEEPDINIPGVFKGPFFNCASSYDLLQMSYSLKKNGRTLFTREDKHWWLTGFMLGEFSEPSELTMNLNVILKDKAMCDAFVKGLKNAGYSEDEIIVDRNVVGLQFDVPRTPQPITRIEEIDSIIQMKNKLLCDKYQRITSGYDNFPDKIKAIQEQAPEMYGSIINMGKSKLLFDNYKIVKKFLE